MYKIDILKMAQRNLWRRKVRTFLTVLGVIIGTTSIVVMLSLGIGLSEAQRSQMEQWGSLTQIQVNQGREVDENGNSISRPLNDYTVEDLKNIEGVTAVCPIYKIDGEATWGKRDGYLSLVGLDATQMEALDFETKKGRLLEKSDRFNIIVGNEVGNQFMSEAEFDQLNKMTSEQRREMRKTQDKTSKMLDERLTMTIMNQNQRKKIYNLTVVGILSEDMKDKAWDAYAPISEIKRIKQFMKKGQKDEDKPRVKVQDIKNRPSPDDYDTIWVMTKDVEQTKKISQKLKDDGFSAYSMADSLEGVEKFSKIIQGVLGGIGSITLIVSALGIINTMIMSIYERTKEIGVMKVIGASFFDIRMLFLTEAGLIGLLGGIVGLILSYIASFALNYFGQGLMGMGGEEAIQISLIPPWLILFALAFSILIGVVAGLYPANRAVKLSPINAIRGDN